MKRRNALKTMLAAGVGAAGVAALPAAPAGKPVQLELDMAVDPSREKEMLHNFETIFRPEAEKHPGYISCKLLKLRSVLQGKAPAGINYRFMLVYQSEELRQKWIATPEHKRVWPTVEKTMSNSKNYDVLLFDVI